MILLVIDTCTERLIAAVRQTIPATEDRWANCDSQGNHARDILPVIEELLEGKKPDVVGAALGPGSFTGVRIGLATAKGLAEGWGVPLVGLDNLEAMALGWQTLNPLSKSAVLPVIDARKKKFYGALYAEGKALVSPSDRSPEDWVASAVQAWAGPVVLSGFQGRLLADALGPTLPSGWTVQETGDWTPGLLNQGVQAFADRKFLGPTAGPRYLRLSEAEENLRLRSI